MYKGLPSLLLGILLVLTSSPAYAYIQTITTPLNRTYGRVMGAANTQEQILDSNAFPIKVYVSPTVGLPIGARPRLLPRDIYQNIRQSVLDWSRILVNQADTPQEAPYLLSLKRTVEEKDAALLEKLGLFTFVTTREQADLVVLTIEEEDLTPSPGDAIGVFIGGDRYPVGMIYLALKSKIPPPVFNDGTFPTRAQRFYMTSFTLRTIMIHELGHALGLRHVTLSPNIYTDGLEKICNIMYPSNYPCTSTVPECIAEPDAPSRCRLIRDQQLRTIVKQLTTPLEDQKAQAEAKEIKAYVQKIDQKIVDQLSSIAPFTQTGSLTITLSAKGELKGVQLTNPFGSKEAEDQLIALVKKIGPFDPVPHSDSGIKFTLAYAAPVCIQEHKGKIQTQIRQALGQLKDPSPGALELNISANGELLNYRITESFGSKAQDRQALAAIESLVPFPTFVSLPARETLNITYNSTIPIVTEQSCQPILWADYVEKFTKKIDAQINIPVKEFQSATIEFLIDRQGKVSAPKILHSTKNAIFDQAALAAIQSASPLDPLPNSYKEDQVEVLYRAFAYPSNP